MKKKIFTLLIACFAMMGTAFAQAPAPSAGFPFKLSGNTTDEAAWYVMRWEYATDDWVAWILKSSFAADNVGLTMDWGSRGMSASSAGDSHLFCFVGDAVNGVSVYCKALLNGKTYDGVTLTEDLKLQNFTTIGEAEGGFTTNNTLSGGDLQDKWLVEVGAGQAVTGGDAKAGNSKIYSTTGDRAWIRAGGSHLLTQQGAVNFTAAYSCKFDWASGQGAGEPTPPAGLPFIPSTDTGSGAHWYYLFIESNYGIRPFTARGLNDLLGLQWGNPPLSDEYMYCFVGDELSGFEIYNKAYLGAGVKVRNIAGGIGVSASALSPDYSTWFVDYDPISRKLQFNDGTGIGWGVSASSSAAEYGSRTDKILSVIPAITVSGNYVPTVSPGIDAIDVAIDAPITISFDNPVAIGNDGLVSWNQESIYTITGGGSTIQATLSISPDGKTVTLGHANLVPEVNYTVTLKNILAPSLIGGASYTWSFTTDQVLGLNNLAIEPILTVNGKEVTINQVGLAAVYSSNGALIKQTAEKSFSLESGFYIIKVGDKVEKVIIK